MYLPRDLWRRYSTRELRRYQARLSAQIAEIDRAIAERQALHPRAIKAEVKRRGAGKTRPWQIREAEVKARAIQVMKLAHRGWTNARIAAKIGLHPSSVSRIVQRQLKAAGARPLHAGATSDRPKTAHRQPAGSPDLPASEATGDRRRLRPSSAS